MVQSAGLSSELALLGAADSCVQVGEGVVHALGEVVEHAEAEEGVQDRVAHEEQEHAEGVEAHYLGQDHAEELGLGGLADLLRLVGRVRGDGRPVQNLAVAQHVDADRHVDEHARWEHVHKHLGHDGRVHGGLVVRGDEEVLVDHVAEEEVEEAVDREQGQAGGVHEGHHEGGPAEARPSLDHELGALEHGVQLRLGRASVLVHRFAQGLHEPGGLEGPDVRREHLGEHGGRDGGADRGVPAKVKAPVRARTDVLLHGPEFHLGARVVRVHKERDDGGVDELQAQEL
mmetsp:Transcript_10565/g.24582  ORF Transcript_10565/g.24582 Transcript_10565/m.24582 type:complete len:287 (-) Transcript_10565:1708-2568(-)